MDISDVLLVAPTTGCAKRGRLIQIRSDVLLVAPTTGCAKRARLIRIRSDVLLVAPTNGRDAYGITQKNVGDVENKM